MLKICSWGFSLFHIELGESFNSIDIPEKLEISRSRYEIILLQNGAMKNGAMHLFKSKYFAQKAINELESYLIMNKLSGGV